MRYLSGAASTRVSDGHGASPLVLHVKLGHRPRPELISDSKPTGGTIPRAGSAGCRREGRLGC